MYEALLVLASAWATPKLGAGTTLVVIVASQVALGVMLDHFGLLGLANGRQRGARKLPSACHALTDLDVVQGL